MANPGGPRESYGLPVTLRENGSRDKEHDCSVVGQSEVVVK